MNVELKKCPFCGNVPVFKREQRNARNLKQSTMVSARRTFPKITFQIYCNNCELKFKEKTKEEVLEKWNVRFD